MNIQERFAKDKVCEACKGTGRRGWGQCQPCLGKGIADLKNPRIRFNWGFHDATRALAYGNVRQVVLNGKQDLRTVSEEFDWWYAAGYKIGLTVEGPRPGSSEPAWLAFTGFQAGAY